MNINIQLLFVVAAYGLDAVITQEILNTTYDSDRAPLLAGIPGDRVVNDASERVTRSGPSISARRVPNGPLFPLPPYSSVPFLRSSAASAYMTGTIGNTTWKGNTSMMPTSSTGGALSPATTVTEVAGGQTGCGETGNFSFGWDDLPPFITNTTDLTRAVPIFSPYHHFLFSEGFVYAPLPRTPFKPVSPPHLAVFITNKTGATNVPSPGLIRPGEIGAGLRSPDQAYWFNAYSAYLGCDSTDSTVCVYEMSGYVYNRSAQVKVLAVQSNITVLPCAALDACPLTFVEFPTAMRALSGLQIRAFVGTEQRIWFMDELALGWWDNTCEAGRTRARSRF